MAILCVFFVVSRPIITHAHIHTLTHVHRMLTGDNILTAKSIAKRCGIYTGNDISVGDNKDTEAAAHSAEKQSGTSKKVTLGN